MARQRSNTSMSARSNQRPDSRASTTSATSHEGAIAGTKRDADAAAFTPGGPEAVLMSYHNSQQSQMMPQYDALSFSGHHHGQSASFPVQNAYQPDQMYMQQDVQYAPQPPRPGSVPVQSTADTHDDKRRKGSAVTATNDKELREMLQRNEGRPLRDVAQEVNQKERTPMAEKTKQLFAMMWLRAVCKPAKTSVPRNRVYSQYANRCATERVVPLNPASFGKLVRVIFPGIHTRRLGVRGESKYHYVDLALEEESTYGVPQYGNGFQLADDRPRSQSASIQQLDHNSIPRLQADTAAFPTTDASFDLPSTHPPTPRGPPSKSEAFAHPDLPGMQHGSMETKTYPHTLRFPPSNLPAFTENEPVRLPPIQPYLPAKTDPDNAEALFALYRTHCTSLIDSIRFCKEKQFFRLYTSFHGTLTVPVQKLFTHPSLAPWIEQCDLATYRTMIRFVSRLTLQAAPVVVINILHNISSTLHSHISRTFASQPQHVLEAKLRPATIFASLLHRLIRVNQSAHAAANLLTIDQNREQMWREWSTMVNPKRVMETELPACGYQEVYKVLTTEMRGLLEPLPMSGYAAADDPYGFSQTSNYDFSDNGSFAAFLQSQNARPASQSGGMSSGVSTENVLDRWSAFISSLPGRFPNASARTLLHCISAVGTAALRDITIGNGVSYGHWWVLKIFVDEMALWGAEMGGFLEPEAQGEAQMRVSRSPSAFHSPVLADDNGDGRSRSHSSTGPVGVNADMVIGYHAAQIPQQQFQQQQQQQFTSLEQFQRSLPMHGHGHQQQPQQMFDEKFGDANGGGGDVDDSGIGMSLGEV